MSYCITVSYLEKESVAHVKVYGTSEEFRSVRISQFQCIGWLLGIFDHAKRLVGDDGILNAEYEQEALERVGGLAASHATKLLTLKLIMDRFVYVWDIISEEEREVARLMNFDHFDNFWPDFDTYSVMWDTCPLSGRSKAP